MKEDLLDGFWSLTRLSDEGARQPSGPSTCRRVEHARGLARFERIDAPAGGAPEDVAALGAATREDLVELVREGASTSTTGTPEWLAEGFDAWSLDARGNSAATAREGFFVEGATAGGAKVVILVGDVALRASDLLGELASRRRDRGGSAIRALTEAGFDVLAFAHPVLARTPLQNAAALVGLLTRTAGRWSTLTLVGMGRGGLVAELTARRLAASGGALPKVSRLILVDAPVGGTALASAEASSIAAALASTNRGAARSAWTTLAVGLALPSISWSSLPGIASLASDGPIVRQLARTPLPIETVAFATGEESSDVAGWLHRRHAGTAGCGVRRESALASLGRPDGLHTRIEASDGVDAMLAGVLASSIHAGDVVDAGAPTSSPSVPRPRPRAFETTIAAQESIDEATRTTVAEDANVLALEVLHAAPATVLAAPREDASRLVVAFLDEQTPLETALLDEGSWRARRPAYLETLATLGALPVVGECVRVPVGPRVVLALLGVGRSTRPGTLHAHLARELVRWQVGVFAGRVELVVIAPSRTASDAGWLETLIEEGLSALDEAFVRTRVPRSAVLRVVARDVDVAARAARIARRAAERGALVGPDGEARVPVLVLVASEIEAGPGARTFAALELGPITHGRDVSAHVEALDDEARLVGPEARPSLVLALRQLRDAVGERSLPGGALALGAVGGALVRLGADVDGEALLERACQELDAPRGMLVDLLLSRARRAWLAGDAVLLASTFERLTSLARVLSDPSVEAALLRCAGMLAATSERPRAQLSRALARIERASGPIGAGSLEDQLWRHGGPGLGIGATGSELKRLTSDLGHWRRERLDHRLAHLVAAIERRADASDARRVRDALVVAHVLAPKRGWDTLAAAVDAHAQLG